MPGEKVRWEANDLHDLSFTPPAISPDGNLVAAAGFQQIYLFSADGKAQGEFPNERYIVSMAWRSDDTLLLLTATYPEKALYLEHWKQDGTLVAPSLYLGETELLNEWRPFTPDGRFLAYPLSYDTLTVRDLETERLWEWDLRDALDLGKQEMHRRKIWTVAWHPEGREVALGLHSQEVGLPLVMWVDATTGEVLNELFPAQNDDDSAGPLTYSPDGRFLAAQIVLRSTTESDVRWLLALYDLTTAGEPRILCEGQDDCCADSPAFSPDGTTLATVCEQRVAFWEVEP